MGNIESDNNRYKSAIKYYNESLIIKPNNKILNNKGNALVFIGKYKEAKKCYDASISIDENFELPWINKINLLERLNDYEEIQKLINVAIKKFNKNKNIKYDLYMRKAEILIKLGNYDEADKLLENVISECRKNE